MNPVEGKLSSLRAEDVTITGAGRRYVPGSGAHRRARPLSPHTHPVCLCDVYLGSGQGTSLTSFCTDRNRKASGRGASLPGTENVCLWGSRGDLGGSTIYGILKYVGGRTSGENPSLSGDLLLDEPDVRTVRVGRVDKPGEVPFYHSDKIFFLRVGPDNSRCFVIGCCLLLYR